jgi:hypothetical protein
MAMSAIELNPEPPEPAETEEQKQQRLSDYERAQAIMEKAAQRVAGLPTFHGGSGPVVSRFIIATMFPISRVCADTASPAILIDPVLRNGAIDQIVTQFRTMLTQDLGKRAVEIMAAMQQSEQSKKQ